MDMVSEWDQDSVIKAGYYEFGAWIAGQEPEETNKLQALSEKTRLKIPYLIGMDAAHGYGTLQGRTIYPTSISMAATFNRDLVKLAAQNQLEKYVRQEHIGLLHLVWILYMTPGGDVREKLMAKTPIWLVNWSNRRWRVCKVTQIRRKRLQFQ